jgi:hypothetical protein
MQQYHLEVLGGEGGDKQEQENNQAQKKEKVFNINFFCKILNEQL